MVIDNKLLLCSDQPVSTSVTSKVLDLGYNGSNITPLYISVKLTNGNSSGTIDTIKVQTAAAPGFSGPIDEMTVNVSKSLKQTKPCNLAQFFCPITSQGRYVRLVFTGSAPVGGKLWAVISADVQVPM